MEALHELVQSFCLCNRTRKSVKYESAGSMLLVTDAVLDHANDDFIRHQLTGVHVFLSLGSKDGMLCNLRAKQIAGREMYQSVALDEPFGLRTFTGSRRTKENYIEHSRHKGKLNDNFFRGHTSCLPLQAMLSHQYYVIYKPFGMLSQFTRENEDDTTLADLKLEFEKDVYPVGRLDKDSEGLLILTNDKMLNNSLLSPVQGHSREYYVQVEGIPTDEALLPLTRGVKVSGEMTRPAKAHVLDPQPEMPPRNPPIRFRASIPDTWISLTLTEGKNRQVRKMTAAVGFPTLRLVRYAIEKITIQGMQPGDVIQMEKEVILKKLFGK